MGLLQNNDKTTGSTTTKQRGDAAEDAALAHLQKAGLRLVARNYRTPAAAAARST
jgi:putative endonuclease